MALFNKQDNPRVTPAATDARRQASDDARNRAPSMLGVATDPTVRPTAPSRRGSDSEPASTEGRDAVGASKLIVGPDIGLEGAKITDCDTLVVEGRVKAQMKSRVIEIAEGGTFEGTVEVEEAVVSGRFDGELTARTRLYVHPTGEVTGTIRYGRLAVEEGGRISGDLGQNEAKAGSSQKETGPAATAKTGEAVTAATGESTPREPETRAAE